MRKILSFVFCRAGGGYSHLRGELRCRQLQVHGQRSRHLSDNKITRYTRIAAIFLRPALSVISFFVACAVMFAIGGFVNSTMREAYLATRADNAWFSLSGIFTSIGYFFVMGGLAIAIVSKSFNLCLTIPETILRWIGSSMTGGESLAGEAKNEFGAAVGVVNSAGHQSLTPGQRGNGVPKVDGAEPTAPGTKMSGPEDPVVPRDSGGGGGQNGGSPERPKPGDDVAGPKLEG